MARTWTVRAKHHICAEVPEGYTIQITTQQNVHDYPTLRNAIHDREGVYIGGHEHDGAWEWY